MKKYTVTTKMSLASGHIELTEDQASVRTKCLEPLKEVPGVYNIIGSIEFKVGEVIGLRPAASDRYIETHTELVKTDVPEMAKEAVEKVVAKAASAAKTKAKTTRKKNVVK